MNDEKDLAQKAGDLCEKALTEARAGLHPLLQSMDPSRLEKRGDFLQAFRSALEKRIAIYIALWQPGIQAVFRFDETAMWEGMPWDGTIHLLVKVSRLSDTVKRVGKKLDRCILWYLKRSGWSRFQGQRSILDIQQVTINELRHGIGYGAMFHAVYNVPVRVWPAIK